MACDAPLRIKYDPPKPDGKGGFIYSFPGDCGKCLKCLNKRKAQWSYRLMEEKRNSFSAYFVTLTYKDEFLIHGDDGPTGSTSEHQEFIKWLKYYENKKRLGKRDSISVEELARIQKNESTKDKELKYYGVLEYGDEEKHTGRPHYHYILFNVHDIDNIRNAWSEQVRVDKWDTEQKYRPGRSKGKVQIDECNVNTIDYTLKYMVKLKPDEEEFENRNKEKSYMSKGLGDSVVDTEFIRYIKRPEGNQVVNTRGFKVALPRFYNKKYLTEEERSEKGRHIKQEIARQDQKKEIGYKKVGVNQDREEMESKKSRWEQMKYRKKRELKDYGTS